MSTKMYDSQEFSCHKKQSKNTYCSAPYVPWESEPYCQCRQDYWI